MDFPHHHQHHQRRDDGEEDRPSFGPQPPHNNFADAPPPPGLYQPQPHFDPYAAPPPPAPYRSEPHFDPYAAPPPSQAPYRSEPQFNPYAAPPPPAPFRSEPYFEAPSPPPPFGHVSHVGHHTSNEPYPPEQNRYGGYPPSNSTLESHGGHAGVTHVVHHSSHQSPTPSGGFHHRPDENRLPDNLAGLAGRSTVKVYSKAEPNYYLTIRGGKVILAPSDPSDEAQHWYKDEKYSTRVKDADGHPCFALVNKATGEAMKHSVGATHPVHLTRYDPDKLDESVLWTESKDLGDGYRTIRMVNNVRLNVDAYHGDSKSGGVRDGTLIVLWDWNKGDNQRWKIFPFCKCFLTFSA
ncbi:Ricin B-like lectin EULS3 [Cardamine amara subsp. amara]|uniref:Ricin B-like lectin EULS3 n=1 Tax=Cardamine amara subsp. amara TaxID=228776 RepID=A0ABD1BCY1_CARAN